MRIRRTFVRDWRGRFLKVSSGAKILGVGAADIMITWPHVPGATRYDVTVRT